MLCMLCICLCMPCLYYVRETYVWIRTCIGRQLWPLYVCIDALMHACMHACMHGVYTIRTCMHTHMQACMRARVDFWLKLLHSGPLSGSNENACVWCSLHKTFAESKPERCFRARHSRSPNRSGASEHKTFAESKPERCFRAQPFVGPAHNGLVPR